MASIVEVETFDQFIDLLENKDKVIIDFHADWCHPCKVFGEYIKEFNKDDKYKEVIFAKVNVDNKECRDIMEKFDVNHIPRVIMISKYDVHEDITGFNKDNFNEKLEKFISKK